MQRFQARRRYLIGLGVAAVIPATAVAQRAQVEVSASRVRFDTTSALTSGTVSPLVELQGRSAYALLTGGFTSFEGESWAVQGRGDGSLMAEPLGTFSLIRVEAVGMAAGTYHSSDFRTAATRVEGRFHLAGRQVGGWLGAVGATGWTSAGGGVATGFGPTAGVWGRWATARAAATFSPVRLEGFWFPELNGVFTARTGPVDVTAYAGWRGAEATSGLDDDVWAGGNVAVWLGRRAALVVAGGSYPSDVLQGLPDGQYLSVGFRVATARPFVPSIKPLGPPVYERRNGDGVLAFTVAGATGVAVVGDWTDWRRVPMQRAPDGRWLIPADLPSGVYRFNLIVDGEEWIVPEGVPSVDDGFGGRTGLLIVP